MEYEEKIHPTVGILVRSNGEVFVPANGTKKAHWTFGSKNRWGYMRVRVNGKDYSVHRLVAGTFLHNQDNKPQVDHINRNKTDNRVQNLRWVTRTENNRNRKCCDHVTARGGTHSYEDYKQYEKEKSKRRSKSNKAILFSDGKRRWLPNSEALLLLAIPVSQRFYKG